jgi:DNA-binding Xre family transcriptional regulator
MAISWRLKTLLSTKYSIHSSTEFKKKIEEKTGVVISLQNVCNLVNKKPVAIRLETIEIICTTLECKLKDFLQIKEKEIIKKTKKKLSFKNTPHSKRTNHFPDPEDYN